MKLLFFLWNPGEQFKNTKHNIGFLIWDELAKNWNCDSRSLDKQSKSLTTSTNVNWEKIILVKPQTFMNLSGQTVSSLLWYYKLSPADIVIVHDDIDLTEWTIKWKFWWSSGWQNWVKDTINKIWTEEFARVRVGIGRPSHPWADVADYVLSQLPKEKLEYMRETANQVLEKLNTHFFIKKD